MNVYEEIAQIKRQLKKMCCSVNTALSNSDNAILNQEAAQQDASMWIAGSTSEMKFDDNGLDVSGTAQIDNLRSTLVRAVNIKGINDDGVTDAGSGIRFSKDGGNYIQLSTSGNASRSIAMYSPSASSPLVYWQLLNLDPTNLVTDFYLDAYSGAVDTHLSQSGIPRLTVKKTTGNVLIGTQLDNTVDTIQVSGSLMVGGNSAIKFRDQDNFIIQESGNFEMFTATSNLILRQDGDYPIRMDLIGLGSYFSVTGPGPSEVLRISRTGDLTMHGTLNLVTPFTPTNSADTSGVVGDIARDDDYVYVKTTTGWKRSALTAF